MELAAYLFDARSMPFLLGLIAFLIARLVDFGRTRALAIAALPVLLVWVCIDPTAHALYLRLSGG